MNTHAVIVQDGLSMPTFGAHKLTLLCTFTPTHAHRLLKTSQLKLHSDWYFDFMLDFDIVID